MDYIAGLDHGPMGNVAWWRMTYSAVLLPTLPSKVRNITQYYYRNQSAIGAANPYWLQSCKVVGTTSQSLDCIVSPALGVCSSALHMCSAFVWQSVFEQRTEDTYALLSSPFPMDDMRTNAASRTLAWFNYLLGGNATGGNRRGWSRSAVLLVVLLRPCQQE